MISIYEHVAMAIDFEGSIQVARYYRKNSICYSPMITVSNTSRPLLIHFQQKVRFGFVNNGSDSKNGWARSYAWLMRIHEIRLHLVDIEPHLFLKREQAQLVLEYLQIAKSRKDCKQTGFRGALTMKELYTEKELERFEAIHARMAILNEKNKPEVLTDAEQMLRYLQGGL